MFDTVLHSGLLIDGTGGAPRNADIGIIEDRVAYIGKLSPKSAANSIDASGQYIAPGFIDVHSHSDLAVFADPTLKPKIEQGITTEIVGQDGVAAAPITSSMIPIQKSLMSGWATSEAINREWAWRSMSDYFDAVDELAPSVNIASLVPHGNLRRYVMDMSPEAASERELAEMQSLLRKSLEEGAVGLSSGLMYLPCAFADTNELRKLTSVCGEYGAPFDVHIREYGPKLLESTQEVLDACLESNAPLHLCHFNVAGKANWPLLEKAFENIGVARDKGLTVTGDQHTYEAASTTLGAAALPPWATSQGSEHLLNLLKEDSSRETFLAMLHGDEPSDFDNWVRHGGFEGVLIGSVSCPNNSHYEGKTIAEISRETGHDPASVILDLIATDTAHSGSPFSISTIITWSNDEICTRVMKDPHFSIGTDALLISGHPHPRCYGTFPRALGKFVRDLGAVPLTEAIRKMTSLAAQSFGIPERGLVREGFFADLVTFDAERVAEGGTYTDPIQAPLGIQHVFTNGVQTVAEGCSTGARPGQALRKQWYPSV